MELEAGQPEPGGLELGRCRELAGRAPQPLETLLAASLQHAAHEGASSLVLGLPQLQAEQSFDEAVAYMHQHTGLTEATARAEVMRYCAWPTQAASYLTGRVHPTLAGMEAVQTESLELSVMEAVQTESLELSDEDSYLREAS